MKTKQCSKCKEVKPLDEFHNSKNNKDGRQRRCKPCNIESASAGFYKDQDKRRRYQNEWDAANRHRNRITLIVRKYGVTRDEAEELEKVTNCQICGDSFETKKQRHVDHCHTTGKVRGVLCSRCNTGLGLFKDSPDRLRKAIEYLASVA